ncbi:tetratricopeptide repeat protein [Roseofilum sp. Guam]|uniref:tetratricopeptide repeat protein n=1 Tax=Roseofilum sp. Guam TaxID=2821502 RepID=UPI001B03483C|nr:tetratricopeptide repeat protein [Roseofilum sp. Guam]MBP0028680.1 tetratricopeptide repeat protein [Roseofilum sp. Guam]
MTKPWTGFQELDRWSAENAEVIADILRALRRKKGFGLFFVQCSPAQGTQVICAIRERFPQKRIVDIELNRDSETLYPELRERHQTEGFEIACISGVEKSLYSYEDTKRLAGWTAKEIYNYSWKGVPPLLSHLNRQREMFEAHLPIRLVFLVPYFVIDYFIQRAPDFFDWRSGLFGLFESPENIRNYCKKLVDNDVDKYFSMTPERCIEESLRIKDMMSKIDPSERYQKSLLLIEQGMILYSNESYTESLNCYNQAIAENPKNHKAWKGKGDFLYELNQYEEVIEVCDRSLDIKRDCYDSWMLRVDALYELQRYKEALTSNDELLKIEPDSEDAWMARGFILYQLEQYEETIKSCDRTLSINDKLEYAWLLRATSLEKIQKYEEALEAYDRVLEIKPDCSRTWSLRGKQLLQLNRNKEAIESCDRSLEIERDDYDTWITRSLALANLEEYEEAIKICENVLEIEPDYLDALILKMYLLIVVERDELALDSINYVLEVRPKYYYALIAKDYILDVLCRYQEAIHTCDHALTIEPGWIHFLYRKGELLVELNRYEEAMEVYNHIIKIRSDYKEGFGIQRMAIKNNKFKRYIKLIQYCLENYHEDVFEYLIDTLEIGIDGVEYIYRIACLMAVFRQDYYSLEFLEYSIDLDAAYKEQAKNDPEFDSLRDHPLFQELIQ